MKTKYNSKGEGFSSSAKKGPQMAKQMEENEKKLRKVGKVRKNKIGSAKAGQVAKTKRVAGTKVHNAEMNGRNRTVLKDDLRKAL